MPIIIQVKVIPNAAHNRIERWENQLLRVRLHAIAEKGKANEALVVFLSEILHLAKSSIKILSGQTTRLKRVSIEGVTIQQFEEALRLQIG